MSRSQAKRVASSLYRIHGNKLIFKTQENRYAKGLDVLVEHVLLSGLVKTESVLFSVIHMHGNRLFRHAQRDHEHVAYELATRMLRAWHSIKCRSSD
ncbi:hypothetical protein D3C76_1607740 [compost metagenome]